MSWDIERRKRISCPWISFRVGWKRLWASKLCSESLIQWGVNSRWRKTQQRAGRYMASFPSLRRTAASCATPWQNKSHHHHTFLTTPLPNVNLNRKVRCIFPYIMNRKLIISLVANISKNVRNWLYFLRKNNLFNKILYIAHKL